MNLAPANRRQRRPHFLLLHHSGDADGFLYYVIPYVEGESLRSLLNGKKRLPIDLTGSVSHLDDHSTYSLNMTTVLANPGAARRESVLTVRSSVSEAWEAEGRVRNPRGLIRRLCARGRLDTPMTEPYICI